MRSLTAARPQRVVMVSMHTSPLAQPGQADAGGLNVYIAQVGAALARTGMAVEILTRSTLPGDPRVVEVRPGLRVHTVVAGPVGPVPKEALPDLVAPMAEAILRLGPGLGLGLGLGRGLGRDRGRDPQWPPVDLIHSHYWISGEVGLLLRQAWGVPLVHSMHTVAARKNESLPPGDLHESARRLTAERHLASAADRLIANTEPERADLVRLYGADPARVDVVLPGVDLATFHPGDRAGARARFGLGPTEPVIAFVGRMQRLKGPDVLLRAMHALGNLDADLAARARVILSGGTSGTDVGYADGLPHLAAELGVRADFLPPLDRATLRLLYSAADVVAMPSHSETFGLVAVEAQACGTPVVATDVGGLPLALAEGRSGILVAGHDPHDWAGALHSILNDPQLRATLAAGALAHARTLSWDATIDRLRASYAGAATPWGVSAPHPRAAANVDAGG